MGVAWDGLQKKDVKKVETPWQSAPLKTSWKWMVGRCIPYWNSPFLGSTFVSIPGNMFFQRRFFGAFHLKTWYPSNPKRPGVLGCYLEDHPRTDVSSWTTLRRWPWCFKVFLLLSAITSGHLRSVGWGGVGWGGVGWGGDDDFPCTCTHGRCYATSCFLHLHTWSVLRNIMFLALAHMVGGWGGVGWGGDDDFPCTCTHGRCYATSCFLHLHTWSVLRNIMFLALAHMVGATQHHVSCICTHGRCYATSCFLHLHTWSGGGVGWGGVGMMTFLALAHMVGATQHHVSCTCTHGRCYATSCFLHLHTWSGGGVGWGGVGMMTFLALAHMVGATQHHVSCTCTHGRCYATSCFLHLHTWSVLRNIIFLALAHMVGATQHHVSCTCKSKDIVLANPMCAILEDWNMLQHEMCVCSIGRVMCLLTWRWSEDADVWLRGSLLMLFTWKKIQAFFPTSHSTSTHPNEGQYQLQLCYVSAAVCCWPLLRFFL